jgi:hypothetical protein
MPAWPNRIAEAMAGKLGLGTDGAKAVLDIPTPSNDYVPRNPPGFVELPRHASPLIESLICQV